MSLKGNPFHCDCRLLSIYEWLEEHSHVVSLDEEEEMVCDQPEKLKHQSIQSLEPIDFCPIPMITTMEVYKLEPSSVRVNWQVQNESLVGGFTLEYYLTSERSLTSPAGLQLNPAARTAELRDLVAEKWYTVCVEANGKYLHTSALSSMAIASSLEAFHDNKPTSAFMLDHHPQKHLLQDFVTSNRKCSQVSNSCLSINSLVLSMLTPHAELFNNLQFNFIKLASAKLYFSIRLNLLRADSRSILMQMSLCNYWHRVGQSAALPGCSLHKGTQSTMGPSDVQARDTRLADSPGCQPGSGCQRSIDRVLIARLCGDKQLGTTTKHGHLHHRR